MAGKTTKPFIEKTEPSITTLSSREVYRNHWMRVREDRILRSNGQEGIYGVAEKSDGAIILPLDGRKIWLVEQFRYPIGERAVELPQGSWEEKVGSPEDVARGELREELGLEAERMTYLGWYWIAYGFLRQRHHVFLAEGLTQVTATPDAEEHDLIARCFPIEQFERMLLDGGVRDGCTLSAWAYYQLWKKQRT